MSYAPVTPRQMLLEEYRLQRNYAQDVRTTSKALAAIANFLIATGFLLLAASMSPSVIASGYSVFYRFFSQCAFIVGIGIALSALIAAIASHALKPSLHTTHRRLQLRTH